MSDVLNKTFSFYFLKICFVFQNSVEQSRAENAIISKKVSVMAFAIPGFLVNLVEMVYWHS